jgi:hypothetical protein
VYSPVETRPHLTAPLNECFAVDLSVHPLLPGQPDLRVVTELAGVEPGLLNGANYDGGGFSLGIDGRGYSGDPAHEAIISEIAPATRAGTVAPCYGICSHPDPFAFALIALPSRNSPSEFSTWFITLGFASISSAPLRSIRAAYFGSVP